jgi:hypothetical protein
MCAGRIGPHRGSHIHPRRGGACDCPARIARSAIWTSATQIASLVESLQRSNLGRTARSGNVAVGDPATQAKQHGWISFVGSGAVPSSVLPLDAPWQITAMPSGSAKTDAARATARPVRNACNTISPAASFAIRQWYGCATERWGMEHSRADYQLPAIRQATFETLNPSAGVADCRCRGAQERILYPAPPGSQWDRLGGPGRLNR